jgi:large subunit ribosomal protein L21
MLAVIEVNGKQFLVKKGDKIRIQSPTVGEIKVLLLADGENIKIGTPYVDGAKVETKIIKQGREKKKIVFRYHSKTRYRKKKGHRQHFTELEILSLSSLKSAA